MEETHVPSRCHICRAWFDMDDLFCHNCGTEAPSHGSDTIAMEYEQTPAAVAFKCEGCGASMNYDATAKSLRCPFCGRTDLRQQANHRSLKPQGVVPFQIDRALAENRLQQFLGSSFWHPSDLRQAARLHGMTPLYVPAWVFDAEAQTYFTADSANVPMGARGDWVPYFGEHQSQYEGILVPASQALSDNELFAVAPFRLDGMLIPDQVDLKSITSEEFQVPQRVARPRARFQIEHLERQACTELVPGRARNVRVNVQLRGIRSRPLLLPIWILAYSYKETVYRVIINGHSGKIAGSAPWSVLKLLLIVGGVIAAILVFLLLLGVLSASSR